MTPDDLPDYQEIKNTYDFPVSDYLKDQIKYARTIKRTGFWWSAALLIEDPRTAKPYIALYRWKSKDGVWKLQSKFNCRSKRDAQVVVSLLEEMITKLE